MLRAYNGESQEEWERIVLSDFPFQYWESVKRLRTMAGIGHPELGYEGLTFIESAQLRRILSQVIPESLAIYEMILKGEMRADSMIVGYFEAPARWMSDLYGLNWTPLNNYSSRFIEEFQMIRLRSIIP